MRPTAFVRFVAFQVFQIIIVRSDFARVDKKSSKLLARNEKRASVPVLYELVSKQYWLHYFCNTNPDRPSRVASPRALAHSHARHARTHASLPWFPHAPSTPRS